MASDIRQIQEEEILSIGRELFSLKTKESVLLDEMNGKTGISAKLQDQLVESTKQLYDFEKKLSDMQRKGLLSQKERLSLLNNEGMLLKSQNDLAKLNLATYNKLNELNLAAYNKLNVAKTKSIGLLGSELQTTAGFITQIGKGLSMGITTFAGMTTIAAGLLEIFIKSFEFFGKVNTSAQQMRDEFGFTRDMLPGIESDISSMATSMARLGVTSESATTAYKAIANVSGIITDDMKLMARDAALFKQTMGATEITTAGIYEKLGASGDASEKTLQNTMLNVQQFAKMAGVAPTKIMVDIAKASGEIVSALRGSASELIKGAITARMLGLDINNVGSAMRQLLNFGQSVNDEMEMSVLLGKNFNLNALRQAAWQGDAVKTAEEQVRLLKQMGGLQGKNMFQIDSMAKTLGLTVDDLQKMNQQQEMLAKASPGVRKGYEASMKAMKSGFDITHANRAEVDAHIKQLEKENQLQNDYTKMQNELKQALVDIYHVFEPIFKLAMMIVTPIAKTAHFLSTWGGILNEIPGSLKLITSLTTLYIGKLIVIGILSGKHYKNVFGITNAIKSWKDMGSIAGVWKIVSDHFKSLGRTSKTLWENVKGFFKESVSGTNMLKNVGKGIIDKFRGKVEEKVTDKITGKATDLAKKSLSDRAKSQLRGPDGRFTKVPKNAPEPVGGGGGMMKGIIDSIKNIKLSQILGASVAMIAFAAALWILSKAVENFGKLDSKSFVRGMSGLAIAAGIMIVSSIAIAAASEVLVPAALIMLSFGAAMWLVSVAAMNFSKAITILFDAFKGLQDVDLVNIAIGLSALGLACYFAMPALMVGSGALGVFAAAMLIAVPIITTFTTSITLLALAIGLVGLALQPITSFFEVFNKTLTIVSGAITTISSAFKETTQSLKELQTVDLNKIASGLFEFSGAMISAYIPLLLGGKAIAMFNSSVSFFANSFVKVSFAFHRLTEFFKTIKSMNISSIFVELSKAIGSLGNIKLSNFEGRGGIMGFFGNLIAGDPIGSMVNSLNKLTGLSPDISKLSETLSVIATSFSVFEQSDVISSGIDKITSSLVKLNEQLTNVSQNTDILKNINGISNNASSPATSESDEPESNTSVVDAINSLIDAVTQQGQSQSDALRQIADVFGSGVDINNFDVMKFAKKMAVTSNKHGGTLAPV